MSGLTLRPQSTLIISIIQGEVISGSVNRSLDAAGQSASLATLYLRLFYRVHLADQIAGLLDYLRLCRYSVVAVGLPRREDSRTTWELIAKLMRPARRDQQHVRDANIYISFLSSQCFDLFDAPSSPTTSITNIFIILLHERTIKKNKEPKDNSVKCIIIR